MAGFDLKRYLAGKQKIVNDALIHIFVSANKKNRIVKAMMYPLMAGGKRLRPILCLSSAEAVGGKVADALRAACAIEMIHTYSLIHDDLPSMDNDILRRGRPTCHVAFDEATAILAGDGLLTFAFEILSSLPRAEDRNALQMLNIINLISVSAGLKGMIEGQMRDILSEGRNMDLEELENMHLLKTGALITASVITGALIGNGNKEQIQSLEIYSNNIGLAFQIADDILNVEGDPAVMGKNIGTDHSHHKNTYPSLLGIDESKALAKKLVSNALQAIDSFDNKARPLRDIARYIIERNK